jgi:type VI secretion system protein VasD
MMNRRIVAGCMLLAAAMLGACSSAPPKPAAAKMMLLAAANVNPDSKGRPSPIVVRLYQLRTEGEFTDAQFFPLYDREKELLAASLITREEYTLLPGEQRELKLEVSPDARFLGVLAAYRDPGAQWRALSPAPAKGLADLIKKASVTVRVQASAVSLEIRK